ncbi:hypothetical protein [Allocatelliglobosispora scoriae]|uniref:hypothetical protein n=1 Tax=Allocatelliglobosispora scoriae TaxID=643052 RepID=UPI0035E3FE97
MDGTLCPQSGFSPFGPLVEVGVALHPVLVAPSLCAALADLGARPHVTPVWLTTWPPETRRALRSPFPGRDWEQIDLDGVGGATGRRWPKWAALTAWLADNADITRVAWVDDDLALDAEPDRHHPAGSRAEFCVRELRRRHLDAFAIAPTGEYGMTPRHLAELEQVIGRGQ